MVWIEIYHLFPGGIIRQVSRAADEGVGLTEFIGSLGPVIPGIPRTPISLRVDDRRGDVRDVAHRGPDPRYVRDHGPPVETEFHWSPATTSVAVGTSDGPPRHNLARWQAMFVDLRT
jgi:hypothetical protein